MKYLEIAKEVIFCFDSKVYDKDFEIVSVEGTGEF